MESAKAEPAAERANLIYARDFLREARRRGLVDERTYLRLRDALEARWTAVQLRERRGAERVGAAVRTTGPARQAATATVAPPMPPPPIHEPATMPAATTALNIPPQRPVRPRTIPEAGFSPAWEDRTRRLRELVASDLGVHGLAYLGVLLLFAGTFGFVFFAFREVARGLRPFAEAAIPAAFFLAAWFLRRRRAPLVSAGVELVGGALLPVVALASFVDGAPPADPTGPGLIAAMTVTCVAVAAAYAAWSARHPSSALRYLTGPTAWLAVAVAGFALKVDEPLRGMAIERPVAWQFALVAAAVAATLVALRGAPRAAARPTFVAAVPGISLAYALTLATAGAQGWPTGPVILAGAAVLVALDALGRRLKDRRMLAVLEPLVLAATVAPLIASIGPAFTGVVALGAFLTLLEWRGRDGLAPVIARLCLTGAAVGLGMAAARPIPSLLGFAVATGWVHVRRLARPSWSKEGPNAFRAGAVVLPAGVAWALLRVLPDPEAWMAIAAALAAVALAVRIKLRRDALFTWWLPTAAAGATVGILVTSSTLPLASRWQLCFAAALSGIALAAATGRPALRVWSAAGAGALSLSLGFDAFRLADPARPLAWSMAGLAAVLAGTAWRREPAGHLAALGHLATLGALAAPASDAVRVGALTGWTGAWLVAVIGQETLSGGGPLVGLLTRAGRWVSDRLGGRLERAAAVVPPLALAVSIPFLVVRAGSFADAFARHRSWSGVALAATALAYAGTARAVAGRTPLAPVLATAAVAVSAIGVSVATPAPWPSIESVAAAIAVVWLLGGELRRPFMTLFAWTMSGLLVVLLANRAGVPVWSLNLVTLAWGTALLVGGLALDDVRSGRRRAGEGVRVPWLVQPVALGALTIPVSLGPVFTYGQSAIGWWMLGGAALYLVVAVQLRAGAVTGATYALATVGLGALSPWSPFDQTWIFVPWCAVLAGLSWAAGRGARSADPWARWDLAPLVVAHAVAVVALVRSVDVGAVPVTWPALGALALALAVLRRQWAWALGGTVLVLVGSGTAGPGWLAVALVGTSAAATIVAIRSTGHLRALLQATATGAAGWAWVEMLVATKWSATAQVEATSLAFGGLALALGSLARLTGLRRDWAAWWGGLAAVAMVAAGSMTVGPDGLRHLDGAWPALGAALFAVGCGAAVRPLRWDWLRWVTAVALGWGWAELAGGLDWPITRWAPATALLSGAIALTAAAGLRWAGLDRRWAETLTALGSVGLGGSLASIPGVPSDDRAVAALACAAGLAMTAQAAALAARPMGVARLRETASVLALAAGSMLLYGWDPSLRVQVVAVAGGGLISMAGSLAIWRRNRESHWLPPLAIFGVTAAAATIPLAASDWSHRELLVAALAVAGAEAAAAGFTLRKIGPMYLSPVLLCSAWLVFASEALNGAPQPFTVPVGLALLVLVELARWDRRRVGKRPVTGELVVLELIGVAFLVGAALVQIVATHLLYGLVATAMAAGVMAWGGMTRVRRRCAFGAGVALLAMALMLAAPIARNVPQFHGATLWITVAAVGAFLIVVATLLEQGRTRIRAAVRRLGELTEGWE